MSSDVLEDFLELDRFAAAVKKHPRTVRRWCDLYGLPYTLNGKTILIHIPTYREWLMGRMSNVRHERPRAQARMKNTTAPLASTTGAEGVRLAAPTAKGD